MKTSSHATFTSHLLKLLTWKRGQASNQKFLSVCLDAGARIILTLTIIGIVGIFSLGAGSPLLSLVIFALTIAFCSASHF